MKEKQDKNDSTVEVNIEGGSANSAQSNPSSDATHPAGDEETNLDNEVVTNEPLSDQQIAELKEKAAKADENWDRFVRLNADFDNFKKRSAKDRLDAIKFANEDLIEKLLPVLDNFEAALAAGANAEAGSSDSVLVGVKMILGQLKNVLTDAGLEEIDAQGKPFDPAIHEALSQEISDEVDEGHVLRQMRKGYKLKERLIRPASVVVAGNPDNAEQADS